MHRWARLLRVVLVRSYREARAEKVTFLAGSIAYHAFLSLLPFMLVLVLLLDAFATEALADRVVELVGGYFTPQTGALVAETIREASKNSQLTFVGFGALAWGMLKIFRSLDVAFSDIYESEAANTTLDQLTDGLFVLVAFLAAVALGATVDSVLPAAPDGALGQTVAVAGVVAGLVLAFFPIYYVFPDEDVTVREVLPGTVFAAVGWVATEAAFQHYARFAAKSDTYGVVGVVVLLLTWLYVSGMVVLMGAILNAVLAGRSEDVEPIDWDAYRAPGASAATDGTAGDANHAADASSTEGADADVTAAKSALAAAVADAEADTDVTVAVDDTTVTLPVPDAVSTHDDVAGDGAGSDGERNGDAPRSGGARRGDDRRVDRDAAARSRLELHWSDDD